MKKLRYIIIVLIVSFIFWGSSPGAYAASYRWNRTHINWGPIKVKFCDGTKKTLKTGDKTGKDVCAFYFKHDHSVTIYVEETGTLLMDWCNVDDSYWYKLTSRTDTRRTANVTDYETTCV